jgi:carboxylate-amine ligase
VRALVETAARQWRDGVPPVPASASRLRLAAWQASRYGLEGELADPATGKPRPASEVVAALLDHLRPVLEEHGELGAVEFLLFQVMTRGTGAARQREVHARTGNLRDVIADAVHSSNLPVAPLVDAKDVPLMSTDQSQ